MTAVETLEATLGLKLTSQREMIYTILIASQQGLSAYEILERLKLNHPKANAMTVYRTLEYFQENNLVHRLENGNKYIICDQPEAPCSGVVQCTHCGKHRELHDKKLNSDIKQLLKKIGFSYNTGELEIKGSCEHCQKGDPT